VSQNEELHRLRKENRELKKKLYKLEKAAQTETPETENDADCYNENSYSSYLFARLRKKGFYAPAKKVAKYVRSSLWLTRLFRLGVLLYQYLQAGAFFILSTAAFILIVPILLAVAVITLGFTILLRRQHTVKLKKEVKHDIVFLFPSGKNEFDPDRIREEVARHPGATVLLVSPFFLGRKGIGDGKSMYITFRKEQENVYILRKYFFFYFRKHLRKEGTFHICEIRIDPPNVP